MLPLLAHTMLYPITEAPGSPEAIARQSALDQDDLAAHNGMMAQRKKYHVSSILRSIGWASWLCGMALALALFRAAGRLAKGDTGDRERPQEARRYRLMQRAVGPLALLGGACLIVGVVSGGLGGAWLWPRSVPWIAVQAGLELLTGLTVAIIGTILWRRTPAAIGASDLRAPGRELGKLMLGVGLPVLVAGISNGLLGLIASQMH